MCFASQSVVKRRNVIITVFVVVKVAKHPRCKCRGLKPGHFWSALENPTAPTLGSTFIRIRLLPKKPGSGTLRGKWSCYKACRLRFRRGFKPITCCECCNLILMGYTQHKQADNQTVQSLFLVFAN